MWFWLSLIALLCWSGSDLFSKIGCRGRQRSSRPPQDGHRRRHRDGSSRRVRNFHRRHGDQLVHHLDLSARVAAVHRLDDARLSGPPLHRAVRLVPDLQLVRRAGRCDDAAVRRRRGLFPARPLARSSLVCVGAIGLGVVDATEDPELRAAPAGGGQLQVLQELPRPCPSRGLLPARRRRHLCRQPALLENAATRARGETAPTS